MSKNLWPDFELGQAFRSPKTVITEAGNGLTERTKGLVIFYPADVSIKDNNVVLSFTLYSRSLSYHFPFLRAKYAIEPSYPVILVAHRLADVVANDENELTAELARIFNAPSTVETIQKLISLGQQ